MEKPTFDELPFMIALLLEKVTRIESILGLPNESSPSIGKEMLTTDEAAEFMGISKSAIYKITHSMAVPTYRPSGKKVYFKKSEVLEYMQSNRSMSMSEIEQEATNYIINSNQKRKAHRFSER